MSNHMKPILRYKQDKDFKKGEYPNTKNELKAQLKSRGIEMDKEKINQKLDAITYILTVPESLNDDWLEAASDVIKLVDEIKEELDKK